MAPRRRTRKVGLTRMDAAIDALVPLGFSKNVIQKTVKALLKVYEGDSGWVFIEEGSYKLVIETILDDQEQSLVKKDDFLEGECSASNISEALEVETRPLDIAEALEGKIGALDIGETSIADSSGEADGFGAICTEPEASLPIIETVSRDCLPAAEVRAINWKDISAFCEKKNGNTNSDHQLVSPPRQRRKPCYGWISSDDDEEDIITLPVSLKLPTINIEGGLSCMKKRKSRWDVKPGDM